ncbi:MAG: hypothetical protein KGZ34_08090 [Nitrosarchaeum sp.]|nr:hypothetical protein [Nitrosarchaeum sp.]
MQSKLDRVMNKKLLLPILSVIIIVGISQLAFAEELEKASYITVDKEQFKQPQSKYSGEQITITGFIEEYTRGDTVFIIVIYPDGTQEKMQTHATKKGEIHTMIQVTSDSQIGVHNIILKYRDIEMASTTLEILERQ